VGIAEEDVAAVKAATDFVAVVSGYLQLKRVGQRWVGLCPFHPEKSPSFSVNPEGFFHCFGCQKGGDAITFVQEIEGVDFAGAVEFLARKANVAIRYTEAGEDRRRARRRQLVDSVAAAVAWYHERLLTAPDAAPARAYLRSRGFDGDRVRRFQLGWAPDGWDELSRALRLGREVAADTGLAKVNSSGRPQDFFRGRVLFPIFDVQGDPVGFGGRLLPGATGPKYLNPGQTLLYDKSKVLYGLNWAKQDAVAVGEIIVCEGYTDVIGFHTAGVPRAVATCGTALTEDHVKLLARFAKRVVLAFDADNAGQAAAARFHEWERRYELDVVVAALPAGVDPGELAQTDPDGLGAAVAGARPFLGFRVNRVLVAATLDTAEGRARAAEAACRVIAAHPDPLVRDQYLLDVAARCRIEVESLRPVLAAALAGARDRTAHAGDRPASRRTAGAAPASTRGADGAPDAAASRLRPPPPVRGAERDALRLAAAQPALVEDWFDPVLFAHPLARAVVAALAKAGDLAGAVTNSEDAVAGLLTQVANEDTDAEAEEVFVLVALDACRRAIDRLKAVLRTVDNPLSVSGDLAHLGRLHTVLIDDTKPQQARRDAGVELLTWLLERPEE
jgi:DNA primase